MKKNILLISPMLHQGGFERICVLTARELQSDYNVTIAVFSMEDLAFDIEGLNVVDLNLPSRPGMFNKVMQVIKRGIALTRLQKKLKIDISYSFGITANIANAFSKGSQKKVVACHSFEEINSAGYMKLIHKGSDVMLCCSKKMAKLVSERYQFSNVKALWNPCDLERVMLESTKEIDDYTDFFNEQESRFLMTMGREDDVKGYWHLLKIFRAVSEKVENVKLGIIGDGEFTEYKELAQKLKIADKVCFTGHKTNPFMYIKKSTAFLMTSISEGLPNSLVEAMALGLLVISVNCQTGPSEILHDDLDEAESNKGVFRAKYGILTPNLNPEKIMDIKWLDGENIELEESERAMADVIVEALTDESKFSNYYLGGPLRARDFSKEAYTKELELLFSSL